MFTSGRPYRSVGGRAYLHADGVGWRVRQRGDLLDRRLGNECLIDHKRGGVVLLGAGSCVIDANQAGNVNYNPAAQVQQTVPVGKGAQTIVFTSAAPTGAVVGGPTYTPTASGGASGNPVVLSIDASATSVCAISITSGVVSFTAVGSCVIDASQAGNANYNPAPRVQQKFAVGMGAQTITFTSIAPTAAVVGGPTYTPMASAVRRPRNPVVLSIDALGHERLFDLDHKAGWWPSPRWVRVSSTPTRPATPTTTLRLRCSRPSWLVWAPRPSCSLRPLRLGRWWAGLLTRRRPSAVGPGNLVVLSIDASATSVCAISITSGVVSFTGAGSCVIDANQAGNANYNAAPQAQQTFTVGKGAQAITFTSTAPTNAVVGGPTYTPTATGGASGNPVVLSIDASATSVCAISITSGVVSFTAAGSCVIDANQAGNADFGPAPQVQQKFCG